MRGKRTLAWKGRCVLTWGSPGREGWGGRTRGSMPRLRVASWEGEETVGSRRRIQGRGKQGRARETSPTRPRQPGDGTSRLEGFPPTRWGEVGYWLQEAGGACSSPCRLGWQSNVQVWFGVLRVQPGLTPSFWLCLISFSVLSSPAQAAAHPAGPLTGQEQPGEGSGGRLPPHAPEPGGSSPVSPAWPGAAARKPLPGGFLGHASWAKSRLIPWTLLPDMGT